MNQDSSQTKWQIHMIFIYYTSYADRNNFLFLKQQNYRRFLIDSETVMKQASFVHYDIAFQKISHNAIVFKDFLNLLPDIAQIVYKKSSRSQAFHKYLTKHIQPLFQQILNKSQFGHDLSVIDCHQKDKKVRAKLEKSPPLQKIYDEYFANMSAHNTDHKKVFQCLTTFLKDFQVCPQVISKSTTYNVFLKIVKQGQEVFNYENFIHTIILISQVAGRKCVEPNLCSSGKIIKLFERMQISSGFERLAKKILLQTGITASLLKNAITLEIETDHCLEKIENQYQANFPASTRHRNCNQSFNSMNFTSNRKEKAKQFQYESYNSFQNNSHTNPDDLKKIKRKFEEMCSYGEVANSKTLKSFKIKKLYERTGLIKLVGMSWLDIQIVNLLRTSESGKMEFFQFLQLMSLTAKKLGVNYDELIELVLKDKQYADDEEREDSGIKKYYLSQEQRIRQDEILKTLSKIVEKIFKHYTNDKKCMNFKEYSKLMYDFEIFPSMISKSKLYKIFCKFSQIPYEKNSRPKETSFNDEKLLGFEGFLLSFCDISQEICEDDLQPNQKLIIMVEKMNESKGCKKLGLTGLLVNDIRNRFAKYYRSFRREEEHVQNFDELMEALY